MKILVTGATGFIGSRLVLKCLGDGYDVVGLGLENNNFERTNRELIEKNGAQYFNMSLDKKEPLLGVLSDTDIVIHLAAAQHEMNIPDEELSNMSIRDKITTAGLADELLNK